MFDNQNNAQNVFLGSDNQSFTGLVSNNDPSDYYNLHITSHSNVNVGFSGLTNNANLYLFDNNSKLLASSTNIGNASESIKTVLDTGNYFVKVDRSVLNNDKLFNSSPYQLTFANDPLLNNAALQPVKHNDPIVVVNPTYTLGSDGANNINTAFVNTYSQVDGARVLGKAIDSVHSIAGGIVQDFESGHIFQSPAGTFAVQGTLNAFYNNLSAADKLKLGMPNANETSVGGYWH